MRAAIIVLTLSSLPIFSACGGKDAPTQASPTIASLTLAGNTPVLGGAGEQMTATALLSNGQTENVTARAVWSSSNQAIVTISSQGVATALSVGSAEIQATHNAVSATRQLSIARVGSSSMAITGVAPPSGSTIRTTGTPPGTFVDRGSGLFTVTVAGVSPRDAPFARLWLYLYAADGSYCGQNLPDAPTWRPLMAGEVIDVAVSGFQVFLAECRVTSIRAMLHTRNTGLLTPPGPADTIDEITIPVNYTFRNTP